MEVPPTSSRRWLWIATIWFGIGLFDATQTVFAMRSEGMHHAWGRLFFTLLISWIPWALSSMPHANRRSASSLNRCNS